MYKIYVAAIAPLMEDDFYQKSLLAVSKDRREKAEKMKQRPDKARSVAAGLLLHYAVKDYVSDNCAADDYVAVAHAVENCSGESGGHVLKQDAVARWDGSCFVKEHGKPMLPEELGLYFNLSHSGDYVLCAVSDRETGADIQRHEKYGDRLAERFFHPEELAYLREAEDRKQCFYDLWCLKESCIKCTGRGLSTGLENFSVVPFFYGEEIMLDGICCAGVNAPLYFKTDLKDFKKIQTKKLPEGYSMAMVSAR